MFYVSLMRFIRGIVGITLSGGFIERFLNLCARAGVPVFDTWREGGILHASTTAHSYRDMRPIAKKTRVRVRIASKQGLPFILHRYRKRVGLAIGVLLFLVFLSVMSRFVWSIEVNGNARVATETILENLEKCGVYEGVYIGAIDTLDAERRMMLLIPDISWMAINLRASTAVVEIRERDIPPERIDDNTPCNVVAARDGQIVEMEIYNGEAVCKVGDAVAQGDLIVSSFVGGIKDRTTGKMTHARAKVMAQFTQEVEIRIPLREELREPTGERVVQRYMTLFGLRLPLSLSKMPPEPYNLFSSSWEPVILGLKLPVVVTRDTFEILMAHTATLSVDQAREEALITLLAYEQDFSRIGQIVSKTASGDMEEDAYVIHAMFSLRQDIARAQTIEIVQDNVTE